jgi:hypothetical protein
LGTISHRGGSAMRQQIVAVATLILAIVAAGLIVNHVSDSRAPLAFCAIAAAIITFFSFVSDLRVSSFQTTLDEGALRRAIAASIVVEYLVLLGMFAFWEGGSETLPPVTQALVTSFTTVVGVVIAFYFGSAAYIEAKTRTRGNSGTTVEPDRGSAAQPGAPADVSTARR